MATNFSEPEGYIRAIIGDTDSGSYQFSSEVVTSHIRLAIMKLDNDDIQETGTSEAFTKTLTRKNLLRVILNVSLSILRTQYDYFSYKTPVHSVTRSGGIKGLVVSLENDLAALQTGGKFANASDNEVDAIFNNYDRVWDTINEAESKTY